MISDNESDRMYECTTTQGGKYLGHLIGYVLRALEVNMSRNEQKSILEDIMGVLPPDYPALKRVKLTNRAGCDENT